MKRRAGGGLDRVPEVEGNEGRGHRGLEKVRCGQWLQQDT